MRDPHPIVLCAILTLAVSAPPLGACSTFQVSAGDTLLIGHNLDDSVETPGMIVVNKRGVSKQSLSYRDINSSSGHDDSLPRARWVSRYGSITYNVFGKEFPDGGMNEKGLYVGEMTLLGSVYPADPALVRIYHHAWMQYLLDNFATVPEVLESLFKVTVDGHCQWHFLVADRDGRAAAIEFDEGKTLTYTGDQLPVKVLTNTTYPSCLKKLAKFAGFGGTREIDYTNCKEDLRFVWAAAMLRRLEAGAAAPTVEQAFDVLRQMWCGANRWSLVYDPKHLRLYFQTYRARQPRYVDFASFDLSCKSPAVALDIHRPLSGDVARDFVPHTPAMNLELLKTFFGGLDVGFFGNLFWKGKMIDHLQAYQQTCACPGP